MEKRTSARKSQTHHLPLEIFRDCSKFLQFCLVFRWKEDEKKADEFIKRKWEEAEEKERQKVIQRKIATKEQLKSLEIAKQVAQG